LGAKEHHGAKNAQTQQSQATVGDEEKPITDIGGENFDTLAKRFKK
jgi:hypothetical protein